MTREETLARVREIEAMVREVRQGTDLPAVERTMQLLELYCHLTRWELGDITAMLPEAEATSTH